VVDAQWSEHVEAEAHDEAQPCVSSFDRNAHTPRQASPLAQEYGLGEKMEVSPTMNKLTSFGDTPRASFKYTPTPSPPLSKLCHFFHNPSLPKVMPKKGQNTRSTKIPAQARNTCDIWKRCLLSALRDFESETDVVTTSPDDTLVWDC
jgi:hypothetical protein